MANKTVMILAGDHDSVTPINERSWSPSSWYATLDTDPPLPKTAGVLDQLVQCIDSTQGSLELFASSPQQAALKHSPVTS